ncbi:GNAT family N-acetyltransferase [Listeria booriae]|uniref:GNAT family N-acetyltransferase n=1 Tax=Listeria booriae TaxID=1552123 RepID=A0A842EX13_9LIST|nr:GNAT family N-acetyltransferase [Listeria booriae]MBC1918473.1 GNAT family N-acetyltransferase [Listeria booriae]MBC2206075.1 GNAT family N-acetyltransferase [Listeria booriae]MBC2240681.1 GNAT family N-acetyltransferase [Listeria booriae]
MQIKTAKTKKDSADISTLAYKIWHEHYPTIITTEQIDYMLAKFQSPEAIEADITSGTIYLMAYQEDKFVGYTAFYQQENELFLSKLYIDPSHHRQGIGKTLFARVTTHAKEQNLPTIRLYVNKYNSNSIEAYKKMGFTVEKALITDVGNNFIMDDYTMTYNTTK